MARNLSRLADSSIAAACVLLCLVALPSAVKAQAVVPGSGFRVEGVGDDFEDVNWEFIHNFPKSSSNIDKSQRTPGGESQNDRWYEGIKRGQPDVIRRVETPNGGLEGSNGALLLQSLHTGIPGRPSFRQQQDDFIANVHYNQGAIGVWQSPSVVTRVFLPPIAQWENRSGCQFAFRVSLDTTVRKGFRTTSEPYYPGFFLDFEDKGDYEREYDAAFFRIRADRSGDDFKAVQIKQTGWWTLGISVTPDGAVHYFAKPGVKDLTAADHVTSQYPFGYDAERFKTFFFNVCNGDDGQTWSTGWIVDDPTVYVLRR